MEIVSPPISAVGGELMLWQSNMWDDYGTCGTCGAKQGEPCREPRPPHREISYAHMARRLTDEAAARARGEKK